VSAKLAPGSFYTLEDQARWYAEQMGEEALQRQNKLARLAAKKCVCRTYRLHGPWAGQRVIHDRSCPRWRDWMGEAIRGGAS